MSIINYKVLISNLPVRQQSFTTKRTTWLKAEKQINWLKQLNDKIFGDSQSITISRQDIFETTDLREVIIKTIYWGYIRGMRGSHFVNILIQIDLIENNLRDLMKIDNPTTDHFSQLAKAFNGVTGLGLSTYSKLLYFLQITFNNNLCLILDQRLLNVFKRNLFIEFKELKGIRYGNAEKKYLNYLQLSNQISEKLETRSENIEQFLFIFGSNIKATSMKEMKISTMWNGYCPESLLIGKTVRMRLNQDDFFESEETGLQISIFPGVQAIILNFRGKGDFRTTFNYADEIENGEILSPQNFERPPFNNPTTAFRKSEEISNYIAKIE